MASGSSTLSIHARAICAAPVAELLRRCAGPELAIKIARSVGRVFGADGPDATARAAIAVARVDARVPRGGNCYRRVLMHAMVEREAASRPIVFGLRAGGGPKSGHAWLEGADAAGLAAEYDAVFTF
jgi:hypothetical protein